MKYPEHLKIQIILPFLVLFMSILSCQNKEKEQEIPSPGKVIIEGRVLSFEAPVPRIEIEAKSFSYTRKHLVQPDSMGRFTLKINKYYPGEWTLHIADTSFPLFSSPGDTLQIKLQQNTATWDIKVQGDTTGYSKWLPAYRDFFQTTPGVLSDSLIQHTNFRNYQKIVFSLVEAKNQLLSNFQKQFHCSDGFIEWAKKENHYFSVVKLLEYRWMHPLLNNQDPIESVPGSFHTKFLKDIKLSDKEALSTSGYNQFLKEYGHLLDLQLYKKRDPEKPVTYKQRIRRIYRKTQKGMVRDYLVTIIYQEAIEFEPYKKIEALTEYIQADMTYDPARAFVMERFKDIREYQFSQNIELQSMNGSVDDFLDSLTAEKPTSLLFIDVWADWCGACIKNFSAMKEMNTHFSGENIHFITFAIESQALKTKQILEEQNLPGSHYLLNSDQTRELKKMFRIEGIPRYILIGKEGQVLTQNAPKPGSKAIQLIEKHI